MRASGNLIAFITSEVTLDLEISPPQLVDTCIYLDSWQNVIFLFYLKLTCLLFHGRSYLNQTNMMQHIPQLC